MLLTRIYSPTMRENSASWTGVNQCFQALSSTAYTAVKASEGTQGNPMGSLGALHSLGYFFLLIQHYPHSPLLPHPVTTIHILSHSHECGLCFKIPLPVEDHILLEISLWISPVDFFWQRYGVWSV